MIPLNVPRAAPGSHTPHLHPENRANVESVWEQELRESWPGSCLFLTSKTRNRDFPWVGYLSCDSKQQAAETSLYKQEFAWSQEDWKREKKLTYFYFYLIIFRTLEAASREEMWPKHPSWRQSLHFSSEFHKTHQSSQGGRTALQGTKHHCNHYNTGKKGEKQRAHLNRHFFSLPK